MSAHVYWEIWKVTHMPRKRPCLENTWQDPNFSPLADLQIQWKKKTTAEAELLMA